MAQVETSLDKTKNQYLYPEDTQSDLENFIISHLKAHIQLPFQLIKKLNSIPSNIGFLEEPHKYFYSIDKTIYFESLTDDNNHVQEIDTLSFDEDILMVSQFSDQPDLMAVSTDSIIQVFNHNIKTSTNLPVDPNPHKISWISTNSGPNILSINNMGVLQVIDINKGASLQCEQRISSPRSISSHPIDPLALLLGDTIQIVDIRAGIAVREITPPPGCLCAEWLPKQAFGAGIGFDNGKIALFNLETSKAVVTQEVGVDPIQNIGFYPRRGTFLMNFSSGSTISYAALPAWGYGHFRVEGSYSNHMGNVLKMNWWKGEENPEYVRMISCDDKSFLHLFELETSSLLIYNPEL